MSSVQDYGAQKNGRHHLFLRWLLLSGFIVFLGVVAADLGYLSRLYASDYSYISLLITFLYVVTSLHCGWRTFYISRQIDVTRDIRDLLQGETAQTLGRNDGGALTLHGRVLMPCLLTALISDMAGHARKSGDGGERDSLIRACGDRLQAQNEYGWFMADILLKLGLLGTVVGFIIMLGSVADITSFDANVMQQVLGSMSSGMGVALFTTLAGLVGGMMLAVQYQLLSNATDTLVALLTRVIEVDVFPRLTPA